MSCATVISYCTNDYRFLSQCIEEAKKFSDQVLVSVCTHFFDGTAENRSLLEASYAAHPDVRFVEFEYLPDRLYSRYHFVKPSDEEWAIYWAATTRYVGFHFLPPAIERVLFLDADEIPEGEKMRQWLGKEESLSFEAQRFGSYLYILQPTLRAKKAVLLGLLVQRKSFSPLALFNDLERLGAFLNYPGSKQEGVVGPQGEPLFHHYSWVRTKQECYQKATTWGHKGEQNWPELIEKAFAGSLENPFDLQLEFEEIPTPYFDPLQVELPLLGGECKAVLHPHVIRVGEKEMFFKEISAL